MKDVTLLIAHCDDEALFAWPILDRVKRIVCASNDAFNPDRAWCSMRGTCLQDVGKLLGCEIVCHANNSEFYRAPTRNGALKLIASDLATAVRQSLDIAPVLFSHNAWGEYGNLDHILCHNIARTVEAETGCELLVTDIAQEINWLPVKPWNQEEFVLRPGDWKSTSRHSDPAPHHIDRDLFDRIKAIYDSKGCWTWADHFGVQETCRIYSL